MDYTPETLRQLAFHGDPYEIPKLLAHADAWEKERLDTGNLIVQCEDMKARIEELEALEGRMFDLCVRLDAAKREIGVMEHLHEVEVKDLRQRLEAAERAILAARRYRNNSTVHAGATNLADELDAALAGGAKKAWTFNTVTGKPEEAP